MRGTARLAGLLVGGTLVAAGPAGVPTVPAAEAGTPPAPPAERVADLNTTLTGGTDAPILDWQSWFVELDGLVLFAADDGIHGTELWASDGTDDGTRLVADVCPGICPSLTLWPTRVGDAVFFSAEDGEHGRELWVTDGTAAGTRLVADLRPGFARGAPGEPATAPRPAPGRRWGCPPWAATGRGAWSRQATPCSSAPSSSTVSTTASSCGRATAPRRAPP